MRRQEIRSVLYVDDDPDICAIVQAALRRIALLEVRTAASGALAIEAARENRPDLILMDVMMPGLDGPSTLKRLREHAELESVPIIFLTAKVLPAEVDRLLRLGAIGVIAKPFDPAELCVKVHELWKGQWRNASSLTDPDNGQAVALDKMSTLTAAYLQRAVGDAARLQDMVMHVRDGDTSILAELERAAHSIYGAAAMFGFPAISALGGAIERLVQGVQIDDPSDIVEQLLLYTEQLAREVGVAAGSTPMN